MLVVFLLAQDVQLKIAGRPLGEVVAQLQLGISVDPELKDKVIRLDTKVPRADVPKALAKAAGGRLDRNRIVAHWRYALEQVLAKKKVNQTNFKQASVCDVLDFLRAVSGVNIVVDPKAPVDGKVDLNVNGVSCSQVLSLLLLPQELSWEVRWGVVFVSTRARLKALPEVPPKLPEPLASRTVDLPFKETSVMHVAAYLTAATGFKFTTVEKKLAVTARASRLAVPHALAACLYPLGCKVERQKDAFVIKR